MPLSTSQTDLWSHYQNENLEVFRGSKARLDFLLRLVGRITKGHNLLNIGCGDGYLERSAQKQKWHVISVDPDPTSKERLQGFGIDARVGSVESLPVNSDSLDVVICTEVFEHTTPQVLGIGLSEIRRVLKSGGFLVGTVPFCENLELNKVFCPYCGKTFHRWGHHQSFDKASMTALLNDRFGIHKVKPVYFGTWEVANWKGKLSIAARLVFSWFGIHGANSNLLFVAMKRD